MQKSVFCQKIYSTCWIWTTIKMTVFNIIGKQQKSHFQGCQAPTSSNIENWQGLSDDRWQHNARNMTSYMCTKTREKDVVGIVTFGLIGLLPTNHIIAHITMAYRSFRGNIQCEKFISSQTTKNIWKLGEREKRFKIRSLPDYLGELTALHFCLLVFTEIIIANPKVNILS